MVYTQREKESMDRVMEVFGDYLAGNQDIDVAYSDKTGFVRLIVAEGADPIFFQIHSFDELVEMFAMDIVSDAARECYSMEWRKTHTKMDYGPSRKRLLEYAQALGEDRDRAIAVIEAYIERWENCEYLP